MIKSRQFKNARSLLCLSYLLCILTVRGLSQEFPCDGTIYYVSTNKGKSTLYQLKSSGVNRVLAAESIPLTGKPRHITCLGYNVRDKKLYGLDFNSHELLRIGSDGTISSLGRPENLDTNFKYYAGDMTPDGLRMVVIARDPRTGFDERIYSIQVNNPPRYYAGYFPVISTLPVSLSDITTDPRVGVIYSFDWSSGKMAELNRNGFVSTSHRPIISVPEGVGSMFFTQEGQLLVLASSGRGGGTQDILYQVDKAHGTFTKLQKIPGGEDTDGCACPYTIRFTKTIDPPEIYGCSTVMIHYHIYNQTGIGQVGTRVQDMLPPQFEIKNIFLEDPYGILIHSGVGTNYLDLDRWTLLLGQNNLRVEAEVKALGYEQIGSQANLFNIPYAMGTQQKSDNPLTSAFPDPTNLLIADHEKVRLADHWRNSCNGDTTFLTVPFQGNFNWNTGSAQSVLPVLKDGFYSVTVEEDCFIYHDSIHLVRQSHLLEVDAGPNLKLKLGEKKSLKLSSNTSSISQIHWTSPDDNFIISCSDCADPIITALSSTTIFLQITDKYGCIAKDTLLVEVDNVKQIFVPSAFTPNNDGINDHLMLFGRISKIENFQIFDRWGNQVHKMNNEVIETSDIKIWDGLLSGSRLPEGIYIWTAVLIFPDQKREQYSGTVLLVN